MLKLIVFLILFSLSLISYAEGFYICDCQPGSDIDCVVGNDSSGDGSIINPWQSFEKARQTFSSMAAGDSVRFCDGGQWNVSTSPMWVNTACRADNRCLISDYTANWSSGDEGLPQLLRTNANHMFAFENAGDAQHEEGYIVENLILTGSGTGVGIMLYNDIDDVDLNHLTISQFEIGVALGESNACDPTDPQCDGRNKRVRLTNSQIFNNSVMGWLGASDDSQIINNELYSNGSTAVFDHNLYLGSEVNVNNMLVSGNTLYRSNLDTNGGCQGVSLVVHGLFSNLLIEKNTVYEDAGTAGGGCWGIAVDAGYGIGELYSNVIIRGNTVKNVGEQSIGVSACVDCVIENNIIINDQNTSIIAIAAPNRPAGTGDAETERVIIRNNSIFMSSGGGEAINVNNNSNNGTGHLVVSNAIHFDGTSSSFSCMNLNAPSTDFNDVDYNICYRPNSVSSQWEANTGSLASWQSASGFDMNSSNSDPGFNDPANDDLSITDEFSLMVDTGHLILSSMIDFSGVVRDSLPDTGAYEWLADDVIFTDSFE